MTAVVCVTGSACADRDGDAARARVEENAEVRRAQARDLVRRAALPGGVGDVIVAAAGSVGATYTVTYETPGADGRITIYADPPRRRVDVSAAGRADRRTISTPDETLACTRRGTETWRCEVGPASDPPGGFALDSVAATIDAIGAQPDVRAQRARIAGVEARCIVSGETELCVSEAGVPLRVRGLGPDADLEAERYRPSADDRDFRSPSPNR